MASTYLSKTLGTATNRKKFTISTWFKLGTSPVEQVLFAAGSGTSFSKIGFNGSGYIEVFQQNSDVKVAEFKSDALLRDPSAWYHLVVAYDTTLSTAADRQKVYLNGTQQTSFDTTNPPTDTEFTGFNNNIEHKIGTSYGNTSYFNGSMAMMQFVDGQQYGPEYFGSTDSNTGIWTPEASSTISDYGTNGFKLKMDTSSPGADTSGKGNTFTPSGTPTLLQGSPSNVFAAWNPLVVTATGGATRSPAFQNGNTTALFDDNGNNEFALTTFAPSKGKWYAEFKWANATGNGSSSVGIVKADFLVPTDINDQGVVYKGDGNKVVNNSGSSYGASWTTGDTIAIVLDCDSNTVNFYKNNAPQGSISIDADTNWYMFCSSYALSSVTRSVNGNFGEGFFGTTAAGTNADGNGQGLFAYAVPSGYYALNTKNLEAYG